MARSPRHLFTRAPMKTMKITKTMRTLRVNQKVSSFSRNDCFIILSILWFAQIVLCTHLRILKYLFIYIWISVLYIYMRAWMNFFTVKVFVWYLLPPFQTLVYIGTLTYSFFDYCLAGKFSRTTPKQIFRYMVIYTYLTNHPSFLEMGGGWGLIAKIIMNKSNFS